jgi:hypothetical protein
MARPVKYDAEKLAEKLNDFIDQNDYPLLENFCRPKDMPRVTYLYDLAKKCISLSEAITRAKDAKLNYITSPDCKLHPKIAGIILASQYNMVERTEVTGKNGGPIKTESTEQTKLIIQRARMVKEGKE